MNDVRTLCKYIHAQQNLLSVVLEAICWEAIPPGMASRLSLGMALARIEPRTGFCL